MLTNKQYFIIGIPRTISGIGHILKSTLSYIVYAKENGYIPIVDLKHYTNQYFKDGRTYKDNTWEYFFEQPENIGLNNLPDDAVIKLNNDICNWPEGFKYIEIDNLLHLNTYTQKNNIKKLNELKHLKNLFKGNIKFNQSMLSYFHKMLGTYNLTKSDKVLGVLCRGTDYLYKKPVGELIQPDPSNVIKKVKKIVVNKKYNKIYLATEDKKVFERFKKEFGEKLLPNFQYMYNENYDVSKFLCNLKVDRKDHFYHLAKEYLFSLFFLSKCNGFIGGYTNGTVIAWILSDNWTDTYIYDLGVYKGHNNLLEKIFSIKNEYRLNGKKYKIVTILGRKMKFKIS